MPARLPAHCAAIALGSNLGSPLGPPEANLRAAVERIGALGSVMAVSSFHATAPVGFLDQPDFVNAALLLETGMEPPALLRALLALELAMGRVRSGVPVKGPRVIDLDLILYDDLTLETPELVLPHPALRERAFVLAPLAEIAADWVDPVTGKTVRELLYRLR